MAADSPRLSGGAGIHADPPADRINSMKISLPQASPCTLHGTWIPGESGGRFVIWGEDARDAQARKDRQHPFCLSWVALASALEQLRATPKAAPRPAHEPGEAWVILPSSGDSPVPSLELQADWQGDPASPESWSWWRVPMLAISEPPQIHDQLPRKGADHEPLIHIGHDLGFWRLLLEALEQSVRRHEYLPAIHATRRSNTRAGQLDRGKQRQVDFRAGWELAESAVLRITDAFAPAMPGACAAIRERAPEGPAVAATRPSARSLIEHFLQVQLQSIVARASLTVKVRNAFRSSFPGHALGTELMGHLDLDPINAKTWGQWWRWRERIQRSTSGSDWIVCFRLADPPPASPEGWRLEWLLASTSDPSLLVPLEEFWKWGTARRTTRAVRDVLVHLGQAARLYEKLWEGMDGAAPSGLDLTRQEALDFLKRRAPILQGAGFRVIVPSWWTSEGQRRLRLRLTVQRPQEGYAGSDPSGRLGLRTLLQFKADLALDGTPVSRQEWERLVEAKHGLVEIRGQWMELQPEEVGRLEEFWNKGHQLMSMTVQQALREFSADGGPQIGLEGDLGLLFTDLSGRGALEQLDPPALLRAQLRPYQLRGYSWLAYLERVGCGACLADDMGLGKTVQAIAAILRDKMGNPRAGPTLVVAPTSVLGNWQRELRRFAPTLVAYVHHGPNRRKTPAAFKNAVAGSDVVVASFGLARLDVAVLSKIRWRRLVVDESQNAKNPSAAVTKALRRIKAESRIAMTGTPVENRLMDLWSLFSIINPGYLGTMTEFRRNFERRIARHGDAAATRQLRRMVRPFILRRMKTDKAIISDLPKKVEQTAHCSLTPEQASLYEAVVRDVERQLEGAEIEGIRRSALVLTTLTRLKQICNHPANFLQDGSAFSPARSHKLARVCEMLDEVAAEEESALVFTQFRELGGLLESLFRRRYGGAVYFLHGGTPRSRREYMVEEFQNPHSDPGIFVLSLRAGGTGINLTRANHVIHFDRWWNPAVEDQATDRAYRIGQEKCVMVHKMITMGTVEERIDEVIESKKALSEGIVGAGESWLAKLDNETLRRLISLDRRDAVLE